MKVQQILVPYSLSADQINSNSGKWIGKSIYLLFNKIYLVEHSEIKKAILKKLFIHRIWGAKHTSIDNLSKGFPSHLRGTAKDVAQELIKEELIISKPTFYGLEVSLNPRKKAEIYALLKV